MIRADNDVIVTPNTELTSDLPTMINEAKIAQFKEATVVVE